MSKTIRLTSSYQEGSETITAQKDYTVGAVQHVSILVAAGTTDLLVAWVMDVSQMKVFWLKANGALEVHTNTLAGTDDLILTADAAIAWAFDSGQVNPLTVDVTNLHVVNAGAAAVQLEIRSGYDPTVGVAD